MSVEQTTLYALAVLAGIAVFTAIFSLVITRERKREWWAAWLQGISTEMIGAIVTVILFSVIVGEAERDQAELESQAQLVRQMRSTINTEAIRAVEELRLQDWYIVAANNGDFEGANLSGANLQGFHLRGASFVSANLEGANLSWTLAEGANFFYANLTDADLTRAVLDTASFWNANLSGANLTDARVSIADLRDANLSGAILVETQMGNTNLSGANLSGADVSRAQFDRNTTLPDGTLWTLETDMNRFTDPNHPNYWQPDSESAAQ